MKPQECEDSFLLKQIQQNDVRAFDILYHRYWATLYAQAYKRLKSRENTEELIQDFFTDLWAKRHRVTIHTSVSAYFRTAVKYLVLHHLQREEVRSRYTTYLSHEVDTGCLTTDELVALHELESIVEQRVASLPPQCKLVYQLSREQHLTIPEISRHMNISPKTAENHLSRALKILRSDLREFAVLLIFVLSRNLF